MKITFSASIPLPGDRPTETNDVFVTADVTPGDEGDRHCPPSGPIPEITRVVLDLPGVDVNEAEDIILDLTSEALEFLEDLAVENYLEIGEDESDDDPPEGDHWDRDNEINIAWPTEA